MSITDRQLGCVALQKVSSAVSQHARTVLYVTYMVAFLADLQPLEFAPLPPLTVHGPPYHATVNLSVFFGEKKKGFSRIISISHKSQRNGRLIQYRACGGGCQ